MSLTKNNLRTWIEIDSQIFKRNIEQLSQLLTPHTALGLVTKADAYGHGTHVIGRLSQETEQVSYLFTAGIAEAVRLRHGGVTKPIVVLAYADDALEQLIMHQIVLVISDLHVARRLNTVASRLQQSARVHIKIDTGMSRLGFKLEQLNGILEELALLSYLDITGISTHLSDTHNSDYTFTYLQLELFDKAIALAEKFLQKKLFTHALASGSLHLIQRYQYDCVRIGSNAYGYWKSPLQKQRLQSVLPSLTLTPVLTWKTTILDIKTINQGDAVGYDRTFTAPTTMKIAILPIGYYDGYPRNLSHKAHVRINGMAAPILGRVSMNLTIIDVSLLDNPQIGDEVALCGPFPKIDAHDLAKAADSMYLEFLTRICPRIPRVSIAQELMYDQAPHRAETDIQRI